MASVTDVASQPHAEVLRASAPERATWSVRVVAMLLDTGVLATLAWFAAPGVTTPGLWPGLPPGPVSASQPEGAGWTSSHTVVAGVLLLLALQGWTGASVGKRAVGIVVVDTATGRPLGVVRTALRQLAHLLDAFLLVGYMRPLWHADRRTFADSVVRSVVVVAPWPPAWRRVPQAVDRWARPVAVALCVAGVVGAFPWTSGGSARAVDQVCRVSTGPVGTTARVSLDVYGSWESRLGVRREVPVDGAPWSVEWRRAHDATWGSVVVVDTTVTALDGAAEGRTWRGSSPNSSGADVLARLGEVPRTDAPDTGSFLVESAVVVDGAPYATCTAQVRVDASDVVVPGP